MKYLLDTCIIFDVLGRFLRLVIVGYLSPKLSSGSSLKQLHVILEV